MLRTRQTWPAGIFAKLSLIARRATFRVKTSRNPFADEVVRFGLVEWWRSGLSLVPRQ
jgi:hypothetical protein